MLLFMVDIRGRQAGCLQQAEHIYIYIYVQEQYKI